MLQGRALSPLFRFSRRLFGRQPIERRPEVSDVMVGYWREMADDALALAEEMKNTEDQRSMREIAAGYELLANGAEVRKVRPMISRTLRTK